MRELRRPFYLECVRNPLGAPHSRRLDPDRRRWGRPGTRVDRPDASAHPVTGTPLCLPLGRRLRTNGAATSLTAT